MSPRASSSSQQSSLSMILISIRRSSLPVILLLSLGAGIVLFYVFSRGEELPLDHEHHRENGNKAVRWSQSSKKLHDQHGWTTSNCRKGMEMLIDLCPCIGQIDTSQHVDKIEDQFVDCVNDCASDNSTDYSDLELEGMKLDDGVEEGKPGPIAGAGGEKKRDARRRRRRR